MHLIQKELNRLVKYGEALGLKVGFVDVKKLDCEAYYIEPYKFEPGIIKVGRGPSTSLTYQIASLLHELGHHIDFTETKKLVNSYEFLDEDNTKTAPDWARRAIYNAERRAVKIADRLYRELALRIPYWKIKRELDCDLYCYGMYKRKSRFPNAKEWASWRKKWKKRNKNLIL